MGLPAYSTENSESSGSDSSVGSTEWDGDNTSDYKGSEEEEEDEDSTEEWDSENVSSLRTETSLRQLLTTDQMITAGELKKNIKESLNILRSCRVVGANSRVNVEGKKVTTRARIGNCPIVASDCIDQMMQDEKDRLFKRVCKGNIQSKDAFMKQSAQFLTFAVDTGELGYDEDNDDLVTLIGRVVLSPVSIVRIYADWLEEGALLAHDSVRGRLCNLSLLLTQFVDNATFRTAIPALLEFIKARVKYHKGELDSAKANIQSEDLLESGLLCSKADLIIMEKRLAPILANIFRLAQIEPVPMQMYTLALRIIGFQFYATNMNGRHRGIAEMTKQDAFKLMDQMFAATAKTKSLKARGNQMITVTDDLASNLDMYWRLLRPQPREEDYDCFFLRFKGTPLSGDDGSKGIATMLDDLFGLYLPVTTLRGINTTQVKICATENEINTDQSNIFHTECQGHSKETADRLYTYMRQPSKAAVLTTVNTTVNNSGDGDGGGDTLLFSRRPNDNLHYSSGSYLPTPPRLEVAGSSSTSMVSTDSTSATPCNNQSSARTITPTKLQLPRSTFDDYGQDHIDFGKDESGHISWSHDEVDYIKQFQASHKGTQVFQRCLESILSNANPDIRKMFHKKHLRNSSVIRDGVKNK
jgi:hypothetical protein